MLMEMDERAALHSDEVPLHNGAVVVELDMTVAGALVSEEPPAYHFADGVVTDAGGLD